MCGIAGFVGKVEIPREKLAAAARALAHRGPDGADSWTGEIGGRHVALVHTRLAIIDVAHRADQPFRDGPVTLVFNGEIYNYLELRDELERKGETFRTTSDTEVLARLLARDGAAALDRMEGMWAFAAVDRERGSLTLSRDRFGEKPLLLWRRPEGLYFASEVKALAALAGVWPAADMERIARFIALGYKSVHKRPGSFFAGVVELPAASVLTIDAAGRESLASYWTLRHAPRAMTRADAVAGVRERLLESLKLRLRSDVPLAFCLSGGVDSGALASLAAKRFGATVEAFTVVDDDPRYDERANAERVVADIGCRWHAVPVDDRHSLDQLDRLVALHDKPVLTISSFVEARLAEAMATHGFKVALSGVGADELFTGYYDHYLFWLAGRAADPAVSTDEHAGLVARWRETYGRMVRNPVLQDPQVFIRDPGRRDHIYLGADQFASWLHVPLNTAFAEASFSPEVLRNRMLNEIAEETVPVMLAESDANFMRVSIENRAPFLDRALAEFAFSVPAEHLVHDGLPKSLLRDAVEGDLDEAVRTDSAKRGFNASLAKLIDSADPAVRERIMSLGPIFDIVDRKAVERLLGRDSFLNSEQKFLFAVLSAGTFLRQATAQPAVGQAA